MQNPKSQGTTDQKRQDMCNAADFGALCGIQSAKACFVAEDNMQQSKAVGASQHA